MYAGLQTRHVYATSYKYMDAVALRDIYIPNDMKIPICMTRSYIGAQGVFASHTHGEGAKPREVPRLVAQNLQGKGTINLD